MLTRNYYNAQRAALAKTLIEDGIKDVYGNVSDVGYYSDYVSSPILTSISFTGYGGIVIGKGTTPATLDDYCLEWLITSGMTASNSRGIDENGNPYTLITLTNITDKAITVGEIGVVGYGYYQAGSSSPKHILLDRTVLESPITIEPGGVGQITYTIRFNYPTA